MFAVKQESFQLPSHTLIRQRLSSATRRAMRRSSPLILLAAPRPAGKARVRGGAVGSALAVLFPVDGRVLPILPLIAVAPLLLCSRLGPPPYPCSSQWLVWRRPRAGKLASPRAPQPPLRQTRLRPRQVSESLSRGLSLPRCLCGELASGGCSVGGAAFVTAASADEGG